MGNYKNGISPEIERMVKTINRVGVKKLLTYYDKHKPRTNFRRQLLIVRSIAQKGYSTTAREMGISYQAVEHTLRRMYETALKVEAEDGN